MGRLGRVRWGVRCSPLPCPALGGVLLLVVGARGGVIGCGERSGYRVGDLAAIGGGLQCCRVVRRAGGRIRWRVRADTGWDV